MATITCPARLHCAHNLSDISAAVSLCREKMKYGPVVPDIEEPFRQWRGCNIGLDPPHEAGILPEPPAGHGQRFTGEIHDGQVAVAVIDQVINQC